MRLVANRQLTVDSGTFEMGQEFDERDDIAKQLVASGAARRPGPPTVQYETKVITPEAPEVSARQNFRELYLPHEESAAVAPEGDSVLPVSGVPASGTPDFGRWGRRARPGAGR